jgi:hypothetical protein
MTAHILILTAALLMPAERQASAAPPAPSSPGNDTRPAGAPAPPAATVEGCVLTAREVRGGAANLAEKIGLDDGFVLTAARVIKGRGPARAAARTARPTYMLEGLSDEQLKPHVGRRVRIEGRFAPDDGAAVDSKTGALAVLTAATIRQVPGDCPAPEVPED